jgi:hypothetical protein
VFAPLILAIYTSGEKRECQTSFLLVPTVTNPQIQCFVVTKVEVWLLLLPQPGYTVLSMPPSRIDHLSSASILCILLLRQNDCGNACSTLKKKGLGIKVKKKKN